MEHDVRLENDMGSRTNGVSKELLVERDSDGCEVVNHDA